MKYYGYSWIETAFIAYSIFKNKFGFSHNPATFKINQQNWTLIWPASKFSGNTSATFRLLIPWFPLKNQIAKWPLVKSSKNKEENSIHLVFRKSESVFRDCQRINYHLKMSGPTTMYALKPIITLPSSLKSKNVLYEMKNIHEVHQLNGNHSPLKDSIVSQIKDQVTVFLKVFIFYFQSHSLPNSSQYIYALKILTWHVSIASEMRSSLFLFISSLAKWCGFATTKFPRTLIVIDRERECGSCCLIDVHPPNFFEERI